MAPLNRDILPLGVQRQWEQWREKKKADFLLETRDYKISLANVAGFGCGMVRCGVCMCVCVVCACVCWRWGMRYKSAKEDVTISPFLLVRLAESGHLLENLYKSRFPKGFGVGLFY